MRKGEGLRQNRSLRRNEGRRKTFGGTEGNGGGGEEKTFGGTEGNGGGREASAKLKLTEKGGWFLVCSWESNFHS